MAGASICRENYLLIRFPVIDGLAHRRAFTLYDWMAAYGTGPTLERPADGACERRFVAGHRLMRSPIRPRQSVGFAEFANRAEEAADQPPDHEFQLERERLTFYRFALSQRTRGKLCLLTTYTCSGRDPGRSGSQRRNSAARLSCDESLA